LKKISSATNTFDGEGRRELNTAFHEAGHAIVGHLLGWEISSIGITAIGPIHGYTSKHRRQAVPGVVSYDIKKGEQSDDGPLADRLTVLYAGVVAEELLYLQRGVSFNLPEEAQQDMHEAQESVQNLSKEEQAQLLNSARERAMKLLSDPQNWRILERIAEKLLESRNLSDPSLRNLLLETQNIMP
jgi:ATP-dependent Zn protease